MLGSVGLVQVEPDETSGRGRQNSVIVESMNGDYPRTESYLLHRCQLWWRQREICDLPHPDDPAFVAGPHVAWSLRDGLYGVVVSGPVPSPTFVEVDDLHALAGPAIALVTLDRSG